MKKLVSLLLTGALTAGLLAGCSGSGSGATDTPAPESSAPVEESTSLEGTTITVGATPAPHAEILEVVKELLAEQGITLDIREFDDYILPNQAVEDGSLDANYFQHITYMDNFNVEYGTHLVSAAEVHYEPFGIYAGKTASLDQLADGAQIAVPNDTTNEGRALLLLQEQGLITLTEDCGLEATKDDIAENPHNYEIVELEARLLPTTLQDVDVAVINGNYAIDAGLKVSDALAIESADGTAAQAYVNVLAVEEGREDDPAIQALAAALCSQEVKDFIDETYEGAVVAVF
ncbi:MAG TPA: MetQ/NlpA family ABC transporter substrate-binding protein [Candidatus Intestinimonas stercoravium]|uniref:MetQ/NlpA family ABC transporter substrate-binding protein n=2 Tax=uncultured Intestinimonas sp. TaxID=1689265 RepID=UPI001F95A1A5|nr:MetQ/NlpA family ABC transporter substrate-binding protein [uncultured Intestinimonas sp.]HJA62780.1 MetQ/NlpA family ABC transporter substrate-binding protein [Candidatus Intestinimonas stercoravium]